MQFKFYPAERLIIESISSRLTAEENALRLWLMDYTIELKRPFNPCNGKADYQRGSHLPSLASSLAEKRAVVLGENGDVNFIYPVSALPTHHTVYLADGRTFNAMCAIDALGATFTFEQDTVVQSKCSECGQAISVSVKAGRITQLSHSDTHALHVDLKKVDNWAGSC